MDFEVLLTLFSSLTPKDIVYSGTVYTRVYLYVYDLFDFNMEYARLSSEDRREIKILFIITLTMVSIVIWYKQK